MLEIFRKYQFYEKVDSLPNRYDSSLLELHKNIKSISLRIGVLDNQYPVFLVGKRDWEKRIRPPSYTDTVRIEKRDRIDEENGSRFNLN